MNLEARGLFVRRGRVVTVRDADFVLEAGGVTAICGPNGAGKSSLLAALAGLIPAAKGDVLLEGKRLDAYGHRERARAIGFLPQDGTVAWAIDVATLVGLGRLPWQAVPGRPPRSARSADRSAVGAALTAMELDDLACRPVSQLSGGERARVLIARVLAGEPRWILADEPLASLDLAHAQMLVGRLRREAATGRGVVIVVHDLATAMNHADRVLVLEKGRLVADAPPEQALSPELMARVWGVGVRWLGDPGSRALSVS